MAVPLVGAQAVRLEFPTRVVFESVSVGIEEGDRIGVVGRNGDGKSSLLGLVSGLIEPDEGKVVRRGGVRFGVLGQTDELDPDIDVGTMIVGNRPEHEWAGDPKVRDVLAGLVADVPWTDRIGALSGGQRRRVALAALLVGDWDVLALDEPTNHLDVEGIAWLAEHLKRRWSATTGGLLVVTHDRWFLDEVCTETWEVHDGIIEPFEGGYAAYVLQRVERDRITAASEAKRQNLMRKELAWLRRGAPARTSKPKFRIDAANALIADIPPVRDSVSLQRMAMARLGKQVVDLDNVSVRYGDDVVLDAVTWQLAPGERTGILGVNGSGKSTLLGLLAGTVAPSTGSVTHGKSVRIGFVDQNFSQLAEIGGERVRDVLARIKATFSLDGRDVTPAQLLERLGFARQYLAATIAELSGGQKRRFQLLVTLLGEPNVLLLDEPTNDVDADMLAATEDLLDSWPGTLVVVSHDRYLLERVTDHQYAIEDGRLRHLPGGVDEYLARRRTQRERVDATRPTGTRGADAQPPHGLSGAERRAAQKELASIERRIDKLRTESAALQQRMADHDHNDYTGLQALAGECRMLDGSAALLEERWLEISESLE